MLFNLSVILLATFLLTSIYHIDALIPTVCTNNATYTGICCPRSKINGMVCGGSRRGICTTLKFPHEKIPEIFMYDDRVEWPKRFFRKVCHCHGNFFGIACDECYYGWKGRNCDVKDMGVRKNIKSLNKRDRNILKHVIYRSLFVMSDYSVFYDQDKKNQDPLIRPIKWIPATIQFFMVFLHRYASRGTLFEDYLDCQNFGFLNFNHNGIIFATWHRYYNLLWERELEKVAFREFGVKNFRLPYWDWTDQKKCDICTNDFVGAPGIEDEYGVRIHHGSPFWNWTEFCVEPDDASKNPCFGCFITGKTGRLTRAWNSYDFPTLADVKYVLSRPMFYDFRKGTQKDEPCTFHLALEGICGRPGTDNSLSYIHNRIHNMIDGSMCCIGTAANDPIFIFHHVQADRIFEAYIKRVGSLIDKYPSDGVRPGHAKMSYLVGFIPLVTNKDMLTNAANLGYEYDTYEFGNEHVLHSLNEDRINFNNFHLEDDEYTFQK